VDRSVDEFAVEQKVLQHEAQRVVQQHHVDVVPPLLQLHVREPLEQLAQLTS
jgi:hypothetical protein